MSRPFILLALSAFLALPLHAQETLVFTPQWTAQAQFAGYYVAMEKGFYDEEGVRVQIVHPNATQSSIERISSNRSHATTLQLAQAVQMIDEGIPLVNLLQTSMNNALVIISRKGTDPLKMPGAKVAIWQAGFTLPEEGVYRFAEHGYNIQEDGLYVTRDYYRKHQKQADAFARASRRGWEYAAAHPEEALAIVMDYVRRNNIATNPVLQRLMLEEILRLQLDPDSGEREFRLREDMLRQVSDLMLRAGQIHRPVTLEDLSR